MTIHISARPGDIAETVLLPGDPYRARWAAQTSDTFYDERPDLTAELARHGCLAVEMEAAELYTIAARHKARALAVLTISDHIVTGEALPSDQREKSFGTMVEIALEAAFA